MFQVISESGEIHTTLTLQEAMRFSESCLERVSIINIATREILYEWTPSDGLKRFLAG